jgi:nucleoside-diphosphate-sugar epimerase
MGRNGGVLVFGSTGPAGEALCRQLMEQGQSVFVVHRSDKRRAEFEAMGARVLIADAMDREGSFAVIEEAAADCDRVVSLIGGFPLSDPSSWPDYVGNVNIIDATLAAGIPRLVLVTSIGTGEGFQYVPEESVTRGILQLKTKAEDHLRATDLDWSIVKPGGLGKPGSVPKSGAAFLTENEAVRGSIDRDELAELIAQVVNDRSGLTRGKTLLAAAVRVQVFEGEATPFVVPG